MRPRIPVILITDSERLAAKSGLCNGVYSVTAKKDFNAEQNCKTAKIIAAEHKFAGVGDYIVVLDSISGNSVHICKL